MSPPPARAEPLSSTIPVPVEFSDDDQIARQQLLFWQAVTARETAELSQISAQLEEIISLLTDPDFAGIGRPAAADTSSEPSAQPQNPQSLPEMQSATPLNETGIPPLLAVILVFALATFVMGCASHRRAEFKTLPTITPRERKEG